MKKSQWVDIVTYDGAFCPVCEGNEVRLLDENFNESYMVTNMCKTCGALWTSLYTLKSVYVLSTEEIAASGIIEEEHKE